VIVFDVQSDMTMDYFLRKHPECSTLCGKLMRDDPFDYSEFATIPGWTLEKCKALHAKFIEARKGATA
jgi:hypothetical protein